MHADTYCSEIQMFGLIWGPNITLTTYAKYYNIGDPFQPDPFRLKLNGDVVRYEL
jgi:hypothetical protein